MKMENKKTYYLVIHEKGRTGVSAALKSVLSKENAQIILQDKGNATITRKEDGVKYLLLDKKYFEYENTDLSKTLFIICNGQKI